MRDSARVTNTKPRTDPAVEQHRIPATQRAQYRRHLGHRQPEGYKVQGATSTIEARERDEQPVVARETDSRARISMRDIDT